VRLLRAIWAGFKALFLPGLYDGYGREVDEWKHKRDESEVTR